MAITAKFTRTLPAPTATISGGFVFLLSAGWFTQADQGAAGSPINGVNSIANGGGDMQVFSDTAATTRLPIEVVSFVTGVTPVAQVWVRTPSYTAGDTITIGKDDTQISQPAVGAAFGRNAVWVDSYELNVNMDSLVDSTGNGNDGTIGSAITTVTGKIGEARRYNGGSLSWMTNGAAQVIDSTQPFIISQWINPSTINTNDVLFCFATNGGSGYLGVFVLDSSYGVFNIGSSDSTFKRVGVNATFPAGVYTKVDIVFDGVDSTSQSSYTIYYNGVPQTKRDIGAFGNVPQINSIGSQGQGFSAVADIDSTSLARQDRSGDYVSSTYNNQNDPDNFGTSSEYVLVGGGGITLTVDSGAYNLTGSSVDLLRAYQLGTSSGSYALTGEDVSLHKGSFVSLVGGTYDYTGSAVTLTYTEAGNYLLAADSGVYTYSGENITFNRDRVIIALNGEYNYSGSSIQIIVPGQIWVDKPNASTDWTNQTKVTTIWTDK